MNYFALDIRKNDVGTRFFDIVSYTLKHFVGELTAIADTGNTQDSNLPAIIFIDFGDCDLELIAYTRENGLNYLPFFF